MMKTMHLPKRALRNVGTAVFAAALACSTAVPGHALARTNRAHVHPVAQEQEPAPSKSRAKKSAAKAPAKPAPKAVSKQTAKPTRGHSNKQVPQPRPDDTQVLMKRAHGAKGPAHVEPLVETRVKRHMTHTPVARTIAKAEPKPAPVAAKPTKPSPQITAALDDAADKAATEKKTLTTEDFLRAAAGTPAPDAPITGESHPDEMDETAPLVAAVPAAKPVAKPVVTATVSANDSPKAPATTARVDGFGAEGAPTHRTIAATLAAHRSKPVPPPVVSAEERNEITDEAVKPMVLPALYTRGGRLIMPAPLKGSHEVLVHQNVMADNDGLDRIQDDDDLNRMVAARLLVRLPESESLHVNGDLPENRRYARPWTVRFVTDIARAYEEHFGVPLQVNSAVRTVNFQLRLMRTNGNAANVDGDTASPHLTGQAIDFGKRGMSKAELAWMRTYLLPLMQAGKVDVEEEFQQACFHISVYKSYMPRKKSPRTEVAAVHHDDDSDAPDAPPLRRSTGPSLR